MLTSFPASILSHQQKQDAWTIIKEHKHKVASQYPTHHIYIKSKDSDLKIGAKAVYFLKGKI